MIMEKLYTLNAEQVKKLVKLLEVEHPGARVLQPDPFKNEYRVITQGRDDMGNLGLPELDLGELVDLIDAKEAVIADAFGEAARAKRDQLLAACDWSQLPDVKQELREAYAGYRQALRDIPDQAGFPYEIEWPEVPGTDTAKLLVKP